MCLLHTSKNVDRAVGLLVRYGAFYLLACGWLLAGSPICYNEDSMDDLKLTAGCFATAVV